MNLTDRIRNGWNAFFNKDPTIVENEPSYGMRPDRLWVTPGSERTILSAIYNRIAIDAAAMKIEHVQLDSNGRFQNERIGPLDTCLTLSANLDQTSRAMFLDFYMTLLDEGCAVVAPVTYDKNGDITGLRVGTVTQWYPSSVKLRLYNETTGRKEEIIFPKEKVAIVENPLYAVMNQPNSTLKRLVRNLGYLDCMNSEAGSSRLNLIIQLPYVIKSDARRQQAEERAKDIEGQLRGSKYGIAYTDGTEKITQLNRSLENDLRQQVKDLQSDLYAQLGLTEEIMNGTANEQVMLNYYNRTIEPIVSALVDEMKRKFLSRTAITQGQTVMAFQDPFRLVPTNDIADIADRFTRNAILSSNEIRGIIGFRPVDDPDADALRNKNLNKSFNGIAEDGYPSTINDGSEYDQTPEDEMIQSPMQDNGTDSGTESEGQPGVITANVLDFYRRMGAI